jgi:hypothetical protein
VTNKIELSRAVEIYSKTWWQKRTDDGSVDSWYPDVIPSDICAFTDCWWVDYACLLGFPLFASNLLWNAPQKNKFVACIGSQIR